MKINSKLLMLLCLLSVGMFSCVQNADDNLAVYSEADVMRNDPLQQILVNTPVISFVAGEPGYDIEFLAIIPNNPGITDVKATAVFFDAGSQQSSESFDLGSYSINTSENTTLIQDNLTYEDLSDGVTVGGQPLPDSQVEVPVGSTWTVTLTATDASGEAVFTGPGIIIGVLSPFAGLYEIIESSYYRINVDGGTWNGEERFIGSIDANTFSKPDWFGPFGGTGRMEFVLNDDNTITWPDTPDQLIAAGNDFLSCQEDAGQFVDVPCEGSNVLEPAADGRHILKFTYGYFTASGDENEGSRQFYEVLRKKL